MDGSWFDMIKEEVEINGVNLSKEGCCFYGDSASLLTYSKCKALSTSLLLQGLKIRPFRRKGIYREEGSNQRQSQQIH